MTRMMIIIMTLIVMMGSLQVVVLISDSENNNHNHSVQSDRDQTQYQHQSMNYLQMMQQQQHQNQQTNSMHHQPTKYKKPVHVTISQESVNRLLSLILLSIISIVGSMGTIFIMSALTVIESLQTRGNCYMVSISMSHLLVNILVLPSSALQLMSLDNAIEPKSLCYYQWKMLLFTMIVNHLSFLFMAADKYLAIKASEKVKTSYTIEELLSPPLPPPPPVLPQINQLAKNENRSDRVIATQRTNNERLKELDDNDKDADDNEATQARDLDEQAALEIQDMLNQINQVPIGSYKSKNQQNLAINPIATTSTETTTTITTATTTTTTNGLLHQQRQKSNQSSLLRKYLTKNKSDNKKQREEKKPLSFAEQIAMSQRDKNIEARLSIPKLFGYQNFCGRLRVLLWILGIWLFALVYTVYEDELTFGHDFCERQAINQNNNRNNITFNQNATTFGLNANVNPSALKTLATASLKRTRRRANYAYTAFDGSWSSNQFEELESGRIPLERAATASSSRGFFQVDSNDRFRVSSSTMASHKAALDRDLQITLHLSEQQNIIINERMQTNNNNNDKIDTRDDKLQNESASSVKCENCQMVALESLGPLPELVSKEASKKNMISTDLFRDASGGPHQDVPRNNASVKISNARIVASKIDNNNNNKIIISINNSNANGHASNLPIDRSENDRSLGNFDAAPQSTAVSWVRSKGAPSDQVAHMPSPLKSTISLSGVARPIHVIDELKTQLSGHNAKHKINIRSSTNTISRSASTSSNSTSKQTTTAILHKINSSRKKFFWFALLGSIIILNSTTGLLFTRAYSKLKQFKSRPYSTLPIEALASSDLIAIMQTSELIKYHKRNNLLENDCLLGASMLEKASIPVSNNNNSLEESPEIDAAVIARAHEEASSPLTSRSGQDQCDNLSTIMSQASTSNAPSSSHRRKTSQVIESHLNDPSELPNDVDNTAMAAATTTTIISNDNDNNDLKLISNVSPRLAPNISGPSQVHSVQLDRTLLNRTPSERYTCSRSGPNEYATSLQRDTSFSAPPTARLPHSADWVSTPQHQHQLKQQFQPQQQLQLAGPVFERLFDTKPHPQRAEDHNKQKLASQQANFAIPTSQLAQRQAKRALQMQQLQNPSNPHSQNLIPISNRNFLNDVLSNLAAATSNVAVAALGDDQEPDDTMDAFDIAPAFRTGRCASDQTAPGSIQHQWLMAQLGVPNYQTQQHIHQMGAFKGLMTATPAEASGVATATTTGVGHYEFRREQHHARSFHYGGSKRNYQSRYSQFLSPLQQPIQHQQFNLHNQQQQQKQQQQKQQQNIVQFQGIQNYVWPAGIQHAHSARVSPQHSSDTASFTEQQHQKICSSDSQLQPSLQDINNNINGNNRTVSIQADSGPANNHAIAYGDPSSKVSRRSSNVGLIIKSPQSSPTSSKQHQPVIITNNPNGWQADPQSSPTIKQNVSQPELPHAPVTPTTQNNLLSLVQKHRESPSPTASSRSHLADRLLSTDEDLELIEEQRSKRLKRRKSELADNDKNQPQIRPIVEPSVTQNIVKHDNLLINNNNTSSKINGKAPVSPITPSRPRLATLYAYAYMPEDQLLRSNMIVFAFNLALWLPLIALWLTSQYKIYIGFSRRASGLEWAGPSVEVKDLVWWVATLNCCASSYIYALTNRDFRDAFNKLFYYFCCKAHVTFPRKTAIFRRQLDLDPETGNVKLHIIPGLNMYSSKLNQMLGSGLGPPSPLHTNHFHYNHHHHSSHAHHHAQHHHHLLPHYYQAAGRGGASNMLLSYTRSNSLKPSDVSDLGGRLNLNRKSLDWLDNLPEHTGFESSPLAARASHRRRPQRRDSSHSDAGRVRHHHMSVGGGFGGPLFASTRRRQEASQEHAASSRSESRLRNYSSSLNYQRHHAGLSSSMHGGNATSSRRKLGRNSERSSISAAAAPTKYDPNQSCMNRDRYANEL